MAHDYTDAAAVNAISKKAFRSRPPEDDPRFFDFILSWIVREAQNGCFYFRWRSTLPDFVVAELKRRNFFVRKTRGGYIIYWTEG